MRSFLSTPQLCEIASQLMDDEESTTSAMLSLLTNKEASVCSLKRNERGLEEWFAREDEVMLEVDVTKGQENVAALVVDYAYSCIVQHGFVGVSICTQYSSCKSYREWLHHSFVLVHPSDSQFVTPDDECTVADAIAGCTFGVRIWQWNQWRPKLHKLLSCTTLGKQREDAWSECFCINPERKGSIHDGCSVEGFTVTIKF
jgi:hypothetical protein